jgi:hypothetical protein
VEECNNGKSQKAKEQGWQLTIAKEQGWQLTIAGRIDRPQPPLTIRQTGVSDNYLRKLGVGDGDGRRG